MDDGRLRRRGDGGAPPPGPARRSGWRRWCGAAAVLAGGAGVGLWSGLFDDVPLLDAATADTVEILAGLALLVSWLRTGRRWRRRTLPALLAAATVTVLVLAAGLRLSGVVTDPYPRRFLLWAWLAAAALIGAAVAPTGGTARRVTAFLAVPLTFAGAFLLVDQEYAVWPRVGSLLGHQRTVSAAPATGGPSGLLRGVHGDPSGRGRLLPLDPPATRSHFVHQPGAVWLPPAYFTPARATLPVLLMLAGTPGTPTQWRDAGRAQAVAASYAAARHGVAPVLVFVDQNGSATGDTECVNRPGAPAETYLTVDVPAFVTGTLGVAHRADRWGVVGFSEGGTCALDLALDHPDLYGRVLDLAGDARPNLGNDRHSRERLFGGSVAEQRRHDPEFLLATHRYPATSAWFVAGNQDPVRVATAHRLAQAARPAGVNVHELVLPGRHDWVFARDALARLFPAVADAMSPSAPS